VSVETPRVDRATAFVDVAAIERNCARLKAGLSGGASLCVVVKADGYGHGIVTAGRAALAGGAEMLAVATAREAVVLREELAEARVFVMGALTEGDVVVALMQGAELAAWRPEQLRWIGAAGRELDNGPPRVHIKHDSGMGRLGERDPEAVQRLCAAVALDEELELAGLWTHFATADEPGSAFFDEQLGGFAAVAERVRADHPSLLVHAANSAATLREPASHFDMVRCGIAVYGLDPFGEDPFARDLEPALELHSYVADVKRFPPGASAGYGQRWRAAADTCVGVLPIGYGDGVRRDLTNNAEVLVEGRRHPLVGTVSMDNVTIDLGPDTDIDPGAPAVLIGAQGSERILAEDWARRLATINYEVTCGISRRVPRTEVRSEQPSKPG
jgi:alanine racemase